MDLVVYYVPRQSSRFLYSDAEFNVRTEGEDGKIASEYKQFDCLGAYDIASEIGKRKRESGSQIALNYTACVNMHGNITFLS